MRNRFGNTREDDSCSYFCMDSTVAVVYDIHFFSSAQEATFVDAVVYWTEIGWPVYRIDSDDILR